MEHRTPSKCLNCGAKLHGEYCSSCGQSEHDGHAPTLGHFGHELFHEFAHVDGKIFRTIKALLLKPGLLTEEYWHGRVTSWIRPLRMFLIVVALNLLIVHDGVGPMNFRVGIYRDGKGTTNIQIAPNPDRQRVPANYSAVPEEERLAFFTKFRTAYSSVRYTSVVLFAFGSWLLFRSRQKYYVNHLIEGLHFYSFWYLLAALGGSVEILRIPAAAGAIIYLLLTIRRLYKSSWLRTVAWSMVLLTWLIVIEGGLALLAMSLAQNGLVWNGSH